MAVVAVAATTVAVVEAKEMAAPTPVNSLTLVSSFLAFSRL